MTVPPGFRRNSAIPGALVLHTADLRKDEIESMHGFGVTRPLRAIADLLIEDSVELGHLRQAVREAFQRGLLSRGEIERSRLSADMKKRIEKFRGDL